MRWLHVHFPKLALEAHFQHDQRELPQLLLTPGTGAVWQCNALAEAQGVKVGMTKKTAFCLLADCALAEYHAHTERDALHQLALRSYHQAANIQLLPPSGLLIEVSSMQTLYPTLADYCSALRQHLAPLGFTAQMATGETPRAARLLAQAGIELCTDDSQKTQEALSQLTIEQLDFGDKLVTKLHSMGIHQYQQLLALPRRELGYRFGQAVVDALTRIERDEQPPVTFQLPDRFQQTVHLSYEAEQARGLIFPLRRVLAALESYLLHRQSCCEKLLIKLEHRDGRASLLTIPSVRGAYRASDWLALLQVQLENTQLLAPVVSLTLRAKGFVPLNSEQEDLVGGHSLQADADRLLARLLVRLGDNQVQRLTCEADPRPETSSQPRPAQANVPEADHYPRLWPSLLLPEPQPVNIQQFQVLSGPERIESGWWEASPIRRDYYIAERHQQRCWLFRRDDGQWFLHGYYA